MMTQESYSEFGKILIPVKEKIIFSNQFVDHYNDLGSIETVGEDPVVSFFSAYRRDFVIDKLEKHPGTSEIFFPVRGTGFMPFAPSLDDGTPDVENIKVFICSEGHPFTVERDVWHLFPFPVEKQYDSYLVVEKELIKNDLEMYDLKTPVSIIL
jgi:ureidoglycolate hydrolase